MKYIEEDEDKIIWGFAKKPSDVCVVNTNIVDKPKIPEGPSNRRVIEGKEPPEKARS